MRSRQSTISSAASAAPALDWSRSWQDSFDDSLVERIKSFVEAA